MAEIREETAIKPHQDKLETTPETTKPNETSAPTPPPDPPFMRMKAKADELREAQKLPKPPGAYVTIDQLQAYLSSLTNDVVHRIFIYVYRLWPLIVREQSDPDNDRNIDKISGLADDIRNPILDGFRAYIVKTHGGGRYRIVVSDVEKKRGDGKSGMLCEAKLSIPETEADPILDINELDTRAKDNNSYVMRLKAKGILDREGNVIEKTNNTGFAGNPLEIMKETVSMMERLDSRKQAEFRQQVGGQDAIGKGTSEVIIELLKQNAPDKNMQLFSTMMAFLKDAAPKGQDSSALMMKMFEFQSTQTNMMMTMLMKIMETNKVSTPSPTAIDPIQSFKGMLEAMTMLDDLRGGRNNNPQEEAPKGVWDRVLDVAEKIGPGLVGTIMQSMALKNGMGGVPPGMQPNMNSGIPMQPEIMPNVPMLASPAGQMTSNSNIPSTLYNPYANPGVSPPAPLETAMPQSNGGTNGGNVIPIPQPSSNPNPNYSQELAQAITVYGDMLVNSITTGQKGYEFADAMGQLGLPVFTIAQQIGQYPMDTIMGTVKNIPAFWDRVKMIKEDTIREWVMHFVNYQSELEKLQATEIEGEDSL